MAIYKTSRYADITSTEIDYVSLIEGGDATPVITYYFAELGQLTWTDYVWRNGDRLDKVSQDYYTTPFSWWIIAEANPEIEDIENIPAGYVLRIPKRA